MGTLVKFHTNEWLPGAVELLTKLHASTHQATIITMRGWVDEDGLERDRNEEWSKANTLKLLTPQRRDTTTYGEY
jgi:hypothetical protein